MDGEVATRFIRDMLTQLVSIKEGMPQNEWLETCLQHQVTLEENIATCTGFTLPQITSLITAMGKAAVPATFKSIASRAVHSKVMDIATSMDIQVVIKSITDVLTDLASMKANLSGDEWEETCLQRQITLEQNIASCTGFTLPQATVLIVALGQAAVPDNFKSDLSRAVQNKILSRDRPCTQGSSAHIWKLSFRNGYGIVCWILSNGSSMWPAWGDTWSAWVCPMQMKAPFNVLLPSSQWPGCRQPCNIG